MFINNDFSEQQRIQTVGVLPTRRPAEYQQELKAYDPAMHGMTDFTSKFAITVAPDRQIDAALADMVRLSVRAMLVVRAESVIGLITSYDISRYLRVSGSCICWWSRAMNAEPKWCAASYPVRESSGSFTTPNFCRESPGIRFAERIIMEGDREGANGFLSGRLTVRFLRQPRRCNFTAPENRDRSLTSRSIMPGSLALPGSRPPTEILE